ncbi:protein kintoun [Callorhinchus milii]|uniref:protein kintoun n=1 Tax=Callorhinchus milii TaxID=7868 RepID=UPI001C3F8FD3|nr:protein kintoun [Callorhinchus milii]
MASRSNREDLDLTRDEVERFRAAFKDEKFKELLFEYVEEISNPENKKKYEEEISQLERDRGVDIKFVHPGPGHVLKSSVNGDQKCFINVCSNELIGKASYTVGKGEKGTPGQHWSLPYSLTPGREELTKGGGRQTIYDVVFHPDTLDMAYKNATFKKMVDKTSMEAIEKQLHVKLDKRNFKTLKAKYKGMSYAAVIRKPLPGGPKEPSEDPNDPLRFPYPFDLPKSKDAPGSDAEKKKTSGSSKATTDDKIEDHTKPTEPKYSILYRSHFDVQDYRNARDAVPSTRPKELVITIDLPLLKSVDDACLDVTEKQLCLESQKPSYKLDLHLSYPVDENLGSAKFNKSKRQLVVTLPVLALKHKSPPEMVACHVSEDEKTEDRNESISGQSLEQESKVFQSDECSKKEKMEDATPRNPEYEIESVNYLQDSRLEQRTLSQKNEKLETIHIESHLESVAEIIPSAADSKFQVTNGEVVLPKFVSEAGLLIPADSEEQKNILEDGAVGCIDKDFLGSLERSGDGSVNELSDDNPGVHSSGNTELDSKDSTEETKIVCPDFHYDQDEGSITFILRVKHIDKDNLKLVLSTHECNVTFGTDECNTLYSLFVQFPTEYQLDTTKNVFSVSQDNAAVVLTKSLVSQGLWQSFCAGESCSCLQKKLFVTPENVDQFLSTSLEPPVAEEPAEKHPAVILQVSEVSESSLVINLKSQEKEDTEDYELTETLDRINQDEICKIVSNTSAAINVQQNEKEISSSETAVSNKLEKDTSLSEEFMNSISININQLAENISQLKQGTNSEEENGLESPRHERNQMTLNSVHEKKLMSKIETETPPKEISELNLAQTVDPVFANGKKQKSVRFKQCVMDGATLDEDDLPGDQNEAMSCAQVEQMAPPPILKEINADGSIEIIRDHRTQSALSFQNTQLFELD